MKKINLILIALVFVTIQACKKDDSADPITDNNGGNGGGNNPPEIAQEQKAVGFYFSGNWCGPCGKYGKPMLKNMTAKYGDDFVVISSQLNSGGPKDPMNCLAANQLAGTFGASGVPTLYTGGAAGTITSAGGGTDMETKSDGNISSIIAKEAIANTKVTATIDGSTISVSTKTKFFSEQSEAYRIAIYVTEDGLAFPQYLGNSQWDNDHIHYNIIRAALTKVGGDDLTTSATANQEIEFATSGTLESAWNTSNLKVAVVLWRVNTDGKITIVNGTVAKVQ